MTTDFRFIFLTTCFDDLRPVHVVVLIMVLVMVNGNGDDECDVKYKFLGQARCRRTRAAKSNRWPISYKYSIHSHPILFLFICCSQIVPLSFTLVLPSPSFSSPVVLLYSFTNPSLFLFSFPPLIVPLLLQIVIHPPSLHPLLSSLPCTYSLLHRSDWGHPEAK